MSAEWRKLYYVWLQRGEAIGNSCSEVECGLEETVVDVVELPTSLSAARMRASVARQSLHLEVRLSCQCQPGKCLGG